MVIGIVFGASALCMAANDPLDLEPCSWNGLKTPLKPGELGIYCRPPKVLTAQAAWIPGRCVIPSTDLHPEFVLETSDRGSHSVVADGGFLAGDSASLTQRKVSWRNSKASGSLDASYDPEDGSWTLTFITGRILRSIEAQCKAGQYRRQ